MISDSNAFTIPILRGASAPIAQRPVVKIHIRSGWCDCECCGSYDWAEASIELPDGAIHEFIHDGHFGYGSWNGDEGQLRLFVLGLLGIVPHIDGEPVDMPYAAGEPDESGEPTMVPVHLAEGKPFEALSIDIEWSAPDPDFKDWREPSHARWEAAGRPCELAMGDKAGYDDLWVAVGESAIDFEIEREAEEMATGDWDD